MERVAAHPGVQALEMLHRNGHRHLRVSLKPGFERESVKRDLTAAIPSSRSDNRSNESSSAGAMSPDALSRREQFFSKHAVDSSVARRNESSTIEIVKDGPVAQLDRATVS